MTREETRDKAFRYLKLCQRCAVLPKGMYGVTKDVPDELLIWADGSLYYPYSLEELFDEKGNLIYLAKLHDLKANSTTSFEIERIVFG